MIRVLNARTMQTAEQRVVREGLATLEELMGRAGRAVAHEILERFDSGRILVLAGAGNNGGDGWVAAQALKEAGRDVIVLSTVEPAALPDPASSVARAAVEAGVTWRTLDPATLPGKLEAADVAVDALVGIGARGELREPLAGIVEALNDSPAFTLAVDMPTGVGTDTGSLESSAVHADLTVTFSALKPALVLQPAASHAGEVVVADIGIPCEMLGSATDPEVWDADVLRALIPLPRPDAHKKSRGSVLVIAGSTEYPGAAILAAQGAQRMGAGYVTLAVPEPVVHIAQAHLRSIVVTGLPSDLVGCVSPEASERVFTLIDEHDAVVLGPGLTTNRPAFDFVRRMIAAIEAPLVVDADALAALAGALDSLAIRRYPTVITPHAGELARILGVKAEQIEGDRLEYATRLAGKARACVLKGAPTVTAAMGRRVVNMSGGPALATAGTGDVLAGMIGALMAQGLGPLEAGVLAAYVHGRAGDAAAANLTPVCVTAEDVIGHVGDAVAELLDWTW